MTIVKAIALAALASTLSLGSGMAFAKSDHAGGQSGTHAGANAGANAGVNAGTSTGVNAGGTLGAGASTHQNTTAGTSLNQNDDADEQGDVNDQGENDNTQGAVDDQNETDGSTATNTNTNTNTGMTAGGNSAAAHSKITVGRVVSALRGGHSSGSISSFTGTSTNVQQISLADVQASAKGNSYVAVQKALDSVNSADIQTQLQTNTTASAALTGAGISLNTVDYAYVDAQGNLVVVTQ